MDWMYVAGKEDIHYSQMHLVPAEKVYWSFPCLRNIPDNKIALFRRAGTGIGGHNEVEGRDIRDIA